MKSPQPRNLIGYGGSPPRVNWPNGAKIAINFVINYEEGAERNTLDGDKGSEDYLVDLPGISSLSGKRHFSSESLFEYGSRAGIWRLLDLISEYHLLITIFATGLALERNKILACKLATTPHEIAGHGYRWIDYKDIPIKKESHDIQLTVETIKKLTGKMPVGWYTGRRSENTRKLIVECGFQYDSDSYNDDLPYWVTVNNKPHLIIPYSLDTNDARFAMSPGFNTGEEFFSYLKSTFDYLYREGDKSAKMMTVALHPRLSGRPGRAEAIRRFIDYVMKYDSVWVCRRQDIAEHWYQHHPRI